jgi:L-ascorbate metabolism protein UlaG (beta-lactamase superfamily)
MKLTWYGHSCFLVETAEGSAVLDPYAPGSVPGLTLPPLRADLVLCSHGHRDHGYRDGARLSGREPAFSVSTLDTWHDDRGGALRGPNTVHILEAEGLRLVHLGDLGHMLSPEQIAALGRVDILLIPVGGHYTIGPETAAEVVRALRPGITVPMHYRGAGFGYDVIGPVEDFLALRGNIVRLDGVSFDPDTIEGSATVVLKCPCKQ